MKYKITKEENMPHPSWKLGDIVELNEGTVKKLEGKIEPYTGDEPNKHVFIEVEPIRAGININQPK